MVTKKSKGLGRGLDALLGGAADFAEAVPNLTGFPNVLSLDVLQVGKYQPRTRMDEGALADLAASIKAQGVMQPILVRPVEVSSGGSRGGGKNGFEKGGVTKFETRFEIIAGERRFRASQLAGLKEIPVLVKDVDDQAAAAMALIENIQREDLNPLEEAQGLQRLINEFEFTHEQTAQAVGRSRSAVSNLLRLLNLASPVQTMLMAGDIDMGHARALLVVESAIQIQLANRVVAKRLSVRDTEKLVTNINNEAKENTPKTREKSRDIERLEEELSDLFATQVQLKMGAKGRGQLIVDFTNLDALDSILTKLRN